MFIVILAFEKKGVWCDLNVSYFISKIDRNISKHTITSHECPERLQNKNSVGYMFQKNKANQIINCMESTNHGTGFKSPKVPLQIASLRDVIGANDEI